MTLYEILSLTLEALVVLILVAEFLYDYWWNSHEQRVKRRKKKDNTPSFVELNTGEMR